MPTGPTIRRPRLAAALLGLLALAPSAALAGAEPLRQALAAYPLSSLASADPNLPFSYFGFKAFSESFGSERDDLTRGGAMPRIGVLTLLQTPAHASIDSIAEAAGARASDIVALTALGRQPADVTGWHMASEDAATAFFDALPERGFALNPAFPGLALNGEPGAVDLASRDPANPWKGMLGQSSAVGRKGAMLVSSAMPASVQAVVGSGEQGLDRHPMFAPALAALAEAARDGDIYQAELFTPALGLQPGDPVAAMLAADPDAAQAAAEAESARVAADGLPPYLGGVMADVETMDERSLAIAFSMPDCDAAAEVGKRIEARWRDLYADRELAALRVAVVPLPDTPSCGMAATFVPSAADAEPLFTMLIGQVLRREADLFAIALPQAGQP